MTDRKTSVRASFKSWLALLIVVATCLVLRLSNSLLLFFAKLWILLPWKPALGHKLVNGLLLAQVKLQQRLGDFAELLWVVTVSEGTSDTFQLEEATGGEGHNGETGEAQMQEAESSPVFSRLSYYCVSEIPNVLAIARYTAANDHDQVMAVAEDMFFDTEEDYARLEHEVEDALLTGVDVCVLSNHDPEHFPTIWGYLADDAAV
jgi:hypothetical protein